MAIGLRQLDHVVAVTGYQPEDVPTLVKTHVGLGMGKRGTEIAKQRAGIILLDDNFNSIVASLEWGRNIYISLKKYVQFKLTFLLTIVVLTLVCVIVR